MVKSIEHSSRYVRVGSSKQEASVRAKKARIEAMKLRVAERAARPALPSKPRKRSQKVWPGWSRKARSRMRQTFLGLDLSPLERPDGYLCLVTVTLPGDWEKYSPTGADWARIMHRFWQRFDRKFPDWGSALIKHEFPA